MRTRIAVHTATGAETPNAGNRVEAKVRMIEDRIIKGKSRVWYTGMKIRNDTKNRQEANNGQQRITSKGRSLRMRIGRHVAIFLDSGKMALQDIDGSCAEFVEYVTDECGEQRNEDKDILENENNLCFERSCDLIRPLPPDLFAELCQQSVQHLLGQSVGVDQAILCKRFTTSGVEINVEKLKNIVNAVTSLFSTAAKHKLSCDELLSTISSGNRLPKPILQVIRHVWNEEGKRLSEVEAARDLVPVGQVVDFQWKIGMAVSSDSCRSLNHPYATLVLKVADYSGQVTSKVIEMTIPEFKNFYRQFKEMSTVLETV
ncbi:COMM domain-containing protein 6 [Pelodytes ibericus]